MSSQQPSVEEDSSPSREAHGSLVHTQEEGGPSSLPQSSATAGQNSMDMDGGQQPFSLQQQFQLDWQTKLEQLQSQHKQESLQQQKEHIEQLRLLQTQIMNELRMNSSLTDVNVPSDSITVSDTPYIRVSHSTDLIISQSSSSPSSAVEGEMISEKSKGLTRAHSLSDPLLSIATTSQTLSPNSSPVRAHSANHTPISSPPRIITNKSSSQPLIGGADEKKSQNLNEVDSSDFSAGHSFGFYQSGAPTGPALVRTSTTESLDQNSAATSIDASPIKLDDDQVRSILPDGDDDNEQSLDTIQRMSPQFNTTVLGGGGTSSAISPPQASRPPQRRLVWTESDQQSTSNPTPLSIPLTKLMVKTSPVSQSIVAPTPQYPAVQLSPVYNNSPRSIRLSPGNANVTLTSPSIFNRGGSSFMNDTQSRATLMEKHRKHMDDLKLYYESELSQLRKKLDQLESERNDPSATSTRRSLSPLSPNFVSPQRSPRPTTPRQTRQMYFPSSLMKGRGTQTPTGTGDSTGSGGDGSPSSAPAVASVVNESELWMLQSENARLKGECSELRSVVDQGQRDKYALEEQVKRLKEHTLDWQGRLEASERMVSVLQERLESTRSQLYDQDKLVGQLRSDLQVAAEELQYWKEQRTQDMEKLDQLFDEFEVLQQENQDIHTANSLLHSQLEETHKEALTYKASLDKYQTLESQYKSTIRGLEDEVRHLQHVNNRLHSMGTHYQLGGYGSPFNQPDEEKVQLSPRSTTSRAPSVTNPPSTPHTSSAAGRRDTPATSAAKIPLTRRKWLESSIPGLIFGGGGEEAGVDGASGKEKSISDDREGTSSVRSQPMVPSSQSRVPAIVNFSSGAKPRSPRKHHPSTSPNRPVSDPNAQQSPMIKAVQKVVLQEDDNGEIPANYGYTEGDLTESALKAVREGKVITTNERSYPSPTDGRKRRTSKAKAPSIEERVKKHMQIVSEAEKKLAELQKEKDKLESSLLKTPRTGTRVTRQSKQAKMESEKLLEEVMKEIGSVRMVLRRHHALKK